MSKLEKASMPLGMIGVISYLIHTTLGPMLWSEYNSMTMDISSLTAVGAPDRQLLMVFTTIYGICVTLFLLAMVVKSRRMYHKVTTLGWLTLFIMNLVSTVGYGLFPLEGDKAVMTFQNTMHIVVTVIVVMTTILGTCLLAIGYMKKEGNKGLGRFALVMFIVITLAGGINPIGMANNWGMLGLTERAVIYSLQGMIFVFSAYYSFSKKENV